jgi:hypothetical protein
MNYENILKDYLTNKQNFVRNLKIHSDEKVKSYKEGKGPDIILIELSDLMLKKYRQTGNKNFLELCSLMRVMAHNIHWTMIKKGLSNKSKKFINVV